ncbi:unnamed protein product, partial [Phaeothamnion confervicola]
AGFVHTAFTFAYEALITKSGVAATDVPPGALLTFLQKGLQYVGVEEHLNEDGTERACDEDAPTVAAGSGAVDPTAEAAKATESAAPSSGSSGGGDACGGGGGAGGTAAALSTIEIQSDNAALLKLHKSEVFMCAWNPVYDLLASGSGDSTARLWEIPMGMPAREVGPFASERSVVLRHSGEVGDKNKDVTTLEWNRNGTLLATGSYDGVARIWDRAGNLKHELVAHDGPIFSLKWNSAGNYVLTGSSDKSSIVWDAQVGTVKQRFDYHEAPTLDVDWQNDTTFATCSTDKAILIQSVGEEYPQHTFTGHKDEV